MYIYIYIYINNSFIWLQALSSKFKNQKCEIFAIFVFLLFLAPLEKQ